MHDFTVYLTESASYVIVRRGMFQIHVPINEWDNFVQFVNDVDIEHLIDNKVLQLRHKAQEYKEARDE